MSQNRPRRRRGGMRFRPHGGIGQVSKKDLREATQARAEAIDRELELKLPLVAEGGYIPTIDHSIPPDVSYANFQYYWERKKKMLGVE